LPARTTRPALTREIGRTARIARAARLIRRAAGDAHAAHARCIRRRARATRAARGVERTARCIDVHDVGSIRARIDRRIGIERRVVPDDVVRKSTRGKEQAGEPARNEKAEARHRREYISLASLPRAIASSNASIAGDTTIRETTRIHAVENHRERARHVALAHRRRPRRGMRQRRSRHRRRGTSRRDRFGKRVRSALWLARSRLLRRVGVQRHASLRERRMLWRGRRELHRSERLLHGVQLQRRALLRRARRSVRDEQRLL
jgi:hypothetical protein